MDEIVIWKIRELEQLIRSESADGSIVSITLMVETDGEERDVDG